MLDPYQTLGITKAADLEEIKKSYRKLAKKYHPDLNPGNKEAEKKFKEISHAFDLIGTKDAKEKFDKGETSEHDQQRYDEFMNRRKGPSFYQTQHDGGRYSFNFGEDINASDFFDDLFGSGRRGGGRDFPGDNVSYRMDVTFKEAALGTEKVITMPDGKSLQVKIPAGIESGKKLRFRGLGGPGIGKGPPGDAYVEVTVKPLEGFKRNGHDIEIELPISFIEAITGAEVEVPTLEGTVMMKIPPGVSTGSKLRIKGKGAGSENNRGNEIVVLKIVVPRDIDPGLRGAVADLGKKYSYNPRTA